MSYTFKRVDWLLSHELDGDGWLGELTDEDGYLVAEVWNNDDDGGNFYIWHHAPSRWGIQEEATAMFPDAEYPLDAWMESQKAAK